MERILVAMSGGVDSSVAALLLARSGATIEAAYMKNWINEDEIIGDCPWMEDIDDARACAERIGIPFRVVNLMTDYKDRVVRYLLDGYRRGLTPNPDVMCNREIKFGVFLDYARANGFDAVATGHYARRLARDCGVAIADCGLEETEPCTSGDEPAAANPANRQPPILNPQSEAFRNPQSAIRNIQLWEGTDKNKDQSYFLALLDQQQLAAARFPIGHLTKPEVRALAAEAGLPTATKKDSQGICFIGNVRMQDFLRAYITDAPGPIVRADNGRELGTHRGLHLHTIGQRKGIGVPSNTDGRAYVVVGKDLERNRLLVAFDGPDAPGLWSARVRVNSLSWIGDAITAPRDLLARVRYRDPSVPARFEPDSESSAEITFAQPQRGLAPGQILALYDGEHLLGGGVYA
ncbi:MAG TPA: tRNA 2-thiouridine(34) synthase MnmA [Opitutaceae bacterium]|nr:tRNA 2-thiouridine(34) synthase MnmA [Opitutaceae bacterium]